MRLGWRVPFLASLGVHALVWLQYRADPFGDVRSYIADALSYHLWAERLVAHGLAAEPVFHQSPLFPLLLSWVYAVAPETARAGWALALQSLLTSAAIAMLVPIGRLWLGSASAGAAAAALALLHGPFVFYSMKLLPVSLALASQAAGLVLLGHARSGRSPARAAAAGAAWGLACLARSEMLLFALPAVAALWWPRRRLAAPVAFLGGLALLVLPATLHNLRQGDFVVLASSSGENLFIGNQRGAEGGYTALHPKAGDLFSQRVLAEQLAERASGRELKPSEVSAYWRGRAWAEVTEEPAAWLRLELVKLGRILHPGDPTDIYSYSLERSVYLGGLHLLPVTPWVLLLLGSVGAALAFRQSVPGSWPVAAWSATHLLVLLLFFVDARLRLPLLFSLCPFAGLALVQALDGWSRGRRRAAYWLAALIGIALASGLWATRPTPRDAVRLASVLSLQQRLDEALAVLKPWLQRPEADSLVLDQAGWVTQKQGRFGQSREHYLQALRNGLAPAREHQTRTRLAQVLERLGELDAAAEQHAGAVGSPHANAGTYYERAMFRVRRGDRAGAARDLQEAIRLDGSWQAPRVALRSLRSRQPG